MKSSGEKGWGSLTTWLQGGETTSPSREGQEEEEEGLEEEGNREVGEEESKKNDHDIDLLVDIGDSSPPVDQRSKPVKANQPSDSGSGQSGRDGWEDWGSEWTWESNQHN